MLPQASSNLPESKSDGPPPAKHKVLAYSLLGLAPNGVYPAIFVTKDAVSSYLTISTLAVLKSHRRYIFCGTFHASLRLAVSQHPALRCPDFPLCYHSGCLPNSFLIDLLLYIVNLHNNSMMSLVSIQMD